MCFQNPIDFVVGHHGWSDANPGEEELLHEEVPDILVEEVDYAVDGADS